jgi:O-antigen biosynthesis protein
MKRAPGAFASDKFTCPQDNLNMALHSSNRLIIILGMHRSGTSLITRALKVFGVDLGSNLFGPKKGDNDKGFFEDIDINIFDRELERALNRDWHFIGPITTQDVEFLCAEGYLEKALELLLSKTKNTSIFGFKDPRVAKLLPFWKRVFDQSGLDIQYLLTIRNPVSVAKSLSKRDALDPEKSYLLWLAHLIPCLTETSSEERVLVDYDVLLTSPEKELRRIAKSLDLTINDEDLASFLSDFLDTNLRHNISSNIDLLTDNHCHPLVADIYSVVLDEASNSKSKHDNISNASIKKWLAEIDRMKSFFALSDKLDAFIKEQEEELRTKVQEIDSLNIYMVAKDQHIHHLKVEVDAKDQHIHHLKVEVDAKDQHIQHLKVEVDAKGQHIHHLKVETEGLTEQNRILNAEIETQTKQLNLIYNSSSWKVTKPLRAAGNFLRNLLK